MCVCDCVRACVCTVMQRMWGEKWVQVRTSGHWALLEYGTYSISPHLLVPVWFQIGLLGACKEVWAGVQAVPGRPIHTSSVWRALLLGPGMLKWTKYMGIPACVGLRFTGKQTINGTSRYNLHKPESDKC